MLFAKLSSQPSLCITNSIISWQDNGVHSLPPLLCFCVLSVCSPPCLPVGTAPGSETCQDAQHKLFVLQFHWRTELFFSLNWGWTHCWLSSLAAVSRCESPVCGCTHLAAEKLWSPLEVTWRYWSEGEDCALAWCSSDVYQAQKNPVTLNLVS